MERDRALQLNYIDKITEAIAGKLLADGLTPDTYTREAAEAILKNCVSNCILPLREYEKIVIAKMYNYHTEVSCEQS